MKKYLALVLLALTSQITFADTPATPVQNLFDAMRAHDGEKLLNQFLPEAILQRAKRDGSIQQSNLAGFAQNITKTKRYLDEHLLAVEVKQSDNLATVWTPYSFYLDGNLSHCGVNSFQVINTENGWKIQYLIDNTHKGDCKTFEQKYKP